MELFRLTRSKYVADLSGFGAAKFGNRWNSEGVEVFYTASSRALAMAEVWAHLSLPMFLRDYVMVQMKWTGTKNNLQFVTPDQLEAGWDFHTPTRFTQLIGDTFVHNKTHAGLVVPSAVVPGDTNVVINPNHPVAQKLIIVDIHPFEFPKRLYTGLG
ncbi:MAG: RES domain-containing protein [Sphingobacteriales bacterium]|jgi:RES domain-containing protein